MTPKERLFARLDGKPVDKIPNLNIVMLFAAQYAGVQYGDFCRDYRYLVEAQTKTAIDFGIDILSTMSDPYREVYDYGGNVSFVQDDLPVFHEALLKTPDDFKLLKDFDPMASTRILDRIKAVECFKQQNGNEFPILGWVEGAWAEFTDLATVSEGMMMMYDEPEFVREAMEFITNKAIECAVAQLRAGADIIGIGDAAASLVNCETYNELIRPFEVQLIDAIHRHGGKTKLHICGNINHLLPDMISTGTDIVDADYMVNYQEAVKLSEGKCSISGNLNPTALIMSNTPEHIIAEVKALAAVSGSTGIISSGCEIPRCTPHENVSAIDAALRN